VAGQLNSYAAI